MRPTCIVAHNHRPVVDRCKVTLVETSVRDRTFGVQAWLGSQVDLAGGNEIVGRAGHGLGVIVDGCSGSEVICSGENRVCDLDHPVRTCCVQDSASEFFPSRLEPERPNTMFPVACGCGRC